MRNEDDNETQASRRAFFKNTAALAAATGVGLTASAAAQARANDSAIGRKQANETVEPFWGMHQGGIATPQQQHVYFAAFDLTTAKRSDVAALLKAWTSAAARMSRGATAEPMDAGLQTAASSPESAAYSPPAPSGQAADSGEALDMGPHRLTVTFGFGPGLFSKEGHDRYGLAARRPEPLVDLPRFPGDQLVEAHTGGDLCIQACADDPQVAFHCVRQLARIASGIATVRWVQAGFLPNVPPHQTARNLMGFKDGIVNPAIDDPREMERFVWVGTEGPTWMRGGSYLVARRIRIALEHWDQMKVAFQEQTVGRHKLSGAPLGRKHESDSLDLEAKDKDGNPIIPENSHVRLSSAAANGGAMILRRGYSYNDGVNLTAERWPPWREGMEYDAGLLFLAYQKDPRSGFILIFDKVARFDMMNQFVTHVGSGLFACPGGAMPGEYVGQRLFEA